MISKLLNNLIPKGFRFTNRFPRYEDGFYTTDNSRIELDRSGFLRFFKDEDDTFYGYASREEMTEQGYGMNPYVFTVVDRLASLNSRLERNIIDKDSFEQVDNIPEELTKLITNPNPIDSWEDLYYRADSNLRVTGETFFFALFPNGFREPAELIVPTSKNVTINEDAFGMPESYDIHYHERDYVKVPKEQVLHIRRPNITKDTLNGLSSLQANRFAYLSNNEVWSSEYFLHKNKGVNGILTNDGQRPLQPSEKRELQAQYDAEATGTNFGKVKVSGQKLRYIAMGMNANDLKSIESRLDHLRQICASQNVDSKLFGDPAASTYNNVPAAKAAMYTDSILPMANKIDKELSYWLFGFFNLENLCFVVDESKIKELNLPNLELSNKVLAEVQSGVLPIEIARHLLYKDIFPMPENIESLLIDELNLNEEETKNNENTDNETLDLNAEAQSRLRGSVGGVQGILEVQAAVASGLTQYDAALTLFTTVYGFDETTARNLLGEEREINFNDEELVNSNNIENDENQRDV